MNKSKQVWLTEAKLKRLGACAEGRRAFRRVAKGRKRVLVTSEALSLYGLRGGKYLGWLMQAMRLSGMFTTRDGNGNGRCQYTYRDGRWVGFRDPKGEGWVYVEGEYVYFGRDQDGFIWGALHLTEKAPEDYGEMARLARQRLREVRARRHAADQQSNAS